MLRIKRDNSTRQPWFIFPKRKASLVIMVVWMLTMFIILGVGLYRITASNVMVAERIRDSVITKHLVKGVCSYLQAKLNNDETDFDTLYELRQEITEGFSQGSARFYLIDEESKININEVTAEELKLLPGLDEDIAKEIYEYEGKPFRAVEELLLVADITPEIYRQVKDYVTVYGKGQLNINTATAVSLEALGFDQGLIDAIRFFRAGSDGQEATQDDQSFESAATILSTLQSYTSLFVSQEQMIKTAVNKGYLGVSSQAYTVDIETDFYGQENNYNIIINKERILRWKRADSQSGD